MNTLESVPLIFPNLLADRKGVLSAVRIAVGPGVPELLISLAEDSDFLDLAARFPCLYFEAAMVQLSPSLVEALTQAGCRPIAPADIRSVNKQLEIEKLWDQPHEQESAEQWLEGEWYLETPAKLVGSQAASRAVALQLVQLVAADAENREIEAVFRRDPTLSYHLLRLVNSLGVGAGRKIASFSQAIVILGRAQLRRWLNLMLFASRSGDPRSAMLLSRVAVRARTMELLGRACGMDNALQEQTFMAGMFSLLGTLFGMQMEEVLRPLMISDAMRAAVLTREGEIGKLLDLLEVAERGDFLVLGKELDAMQVAHADFNAIVIQACNWMLDVARDTQDQGGRHA